MISLGFLSVPFQTAAIAAEALRTRFLMSASATKIDADQAIQFE